ncbi:MAG: CvpA family protein [Lentimicrobium sp.]|nr:CvpA family protein [Lentimicrobium sp.]
MNIIDAVIFISLIIAAITGFFKGFIISVASFVGFLLGIILSFRFAGSVQQLLIEITGSEGRYLYFVGFLICFALVVVIVQLIGKAIEKIVKAVALGFLNRITGAGFGVLKSLLIFSALIYALAYIDPKNRLITPEQQKNSLFYQPLEKLLPSILPFIRHHLEELDEIITPDEKKILV